jgi:hypothetical protein
MRFDLSNHIWAFPEPLKSCTSARADERKITNVIFYALRRMAWRDARRCGTSGLKIATIRLKFEVHPENSVA